MSAFLQESESRRLAAFMEIATRMGLNEDAVEKDFWVCWTLRELLADPITGARLTFKGGTSLAKAWNLIERFSEDLDLVVDREAFGFGGDQAPSSAASRKQRERRLDELRNRCALWVQGPALTALTRRSLVSPIAAMGRVLMDPRDKDGATLLFQYKAITNPSGYLNPEVRLEFGARSDVEPQEVRRVSSYLHLHLPSLDPDTICDVRVLAAERTFWEKACLLHEENLRLEHRARERLSRHLYDIWCLIRAGTSGRALADDGLFARVVAHRLVYFRQSWMKEADYAAASFQLVPPEDRLQAWRADFEQMRENMFFGEVPEFDEIIRVIGEFQSQVRLSGLRHVP